MLRGRGGRHKLRVRPFWPMRGARNQQDCEGLRRSPSRHGVCSSAVALRCDWPPRLAAKLLGLGERGLGFDLCARGARAPRRAPDVRAPRLGRCARIVSYSPSAAPASPRATATVASPRWHSSAWGSTAKASAVSLFGAGRGRRRAPGPDRGRATLRRRWRRGAPLLRDAAAPTRPRPNRAARMPPSRGPRGSAGAISAA